MDQGSFTVLIFSSTPHKLSNDLLMPFSEVIEVNSISEIYSTLAYQEITAVLIFGDQPNIDYQGLFRTIRYLYPRVQLILITESDHPDNLHYFYAGSIDDLLYVGMPEKDVKKLLIRAINNYIKTKKIEDELEQLRDIIRRDSLVSTYNDMFVDLTVELTDDDEVRDFANQYITVLAGLQSLIRLNYSLFVKNQDKSITQNILGTISDIEVLANRYDQTIIMIYINILRAYLALDLKEFKNAILFYQASVRIFHWLSSEHVDPSLILSITDFPIYEDEWEDIMGSNKYYILSEEVRDLVKLRINHLLSQEIVEFINITEKLNSQLGTEYQHLQQLIISRGSLPLYTVNMTPEKLRVELVTGFIGALSEFLTDAVQGESGIDKVIHDRGTILVHKLGEYNFILLSNSDDYHLRTALKQFAIQSKIIVEQIPPNQMAEPPKKTDLDIIFNKVFFPEY